MNDFGLVAQRAAEARLELMEELLGLECVGEKPEWPDDMLAPYCGCLTCQVRETLQAAWVVFLDYDVVRDQSSPADYEEGGRPPLHGEAGSRRPAEARDSGSKTALLSPSDAQAAIAAARPIILNALRGDLDKELALGWIEALFQPCP